MEDRRDMYQVSFRKNLINYCKWEAFDCCLSIRSVYKAIILRVITDLFYFFVNRINESFT